MLLRKLHYRDNTTDPRSSSAAKQTVRICHGAETADWLRFKDETGIWASRLQPIRQGTGIALGCRYVQPQSKWNIKNDNECRQTQVRLDKTSEGVVSKAEEAGCRSSAAEARTPHSSGWRLLGCKSGSINTPTRAWLGVSFREILAFWNYMLF